MKKIILSVAVATMALSTVASALEDIKVSGQAKLWYETSDQGDDRTLLNADSASGEVVFKLGVTGKQGNVGFGTTVYQTSSMGLENEVVSATRTNTTNLQTNGTPFVGEAYITAPTLASTTLKFGKQELDTPLAFTERWNAVPNSFNAALLVNSSVENLTLIAGYVGQDNATTFKVDGEVNQSYFGGAYTAAALYKTDAFGANFWVYQINNVAGDSALAYWLDASVKAGPVAVKAYAAMLTNDGDKAAGGLSGEDTTAFALSVAGKAGPVALFAAGSTVSEDGDLAVANTSTGFKKTKLPTAGVYTDGVYVAQPGSVAFKLKASGKMGTTGVALQAVMNENSDKRWDGNIAGSKDTTEIDLIITQKLSDFNFKLLVMNRSFAETAADDKSGGNYVRLVTSVNF